MKFLSLFLKKFGPFTDRTIELAERDGPGLVVLYGPNEAGKSSALRAIHDLLYGMPVRTRDDFLHRKSELRVGAHLLFSDGEELAVLRRKGNKNTLRTLDDREVLAAPRLDALVEAIPESHFRNFYGLDHRQLAYGSAALLADDGELGRVLFGAGMGSGHFRQVLSDLESEAAALFAPRGSKLPINRAIKEWEDLRRSVGKEALRPADWEERQAQLAADERRLAELDRELEAERASLSRLQRIQRVLPALGKRRHALEQMHAAGSVPALREDFEERLRKARAERDQAQLISDRARQILDKEGEKRAALPAVSSLLPLADRVDHLHEALGGYKDLCRDLPKRIAELAALDESIEAIFAALGAAHTPAQLEDFRRGQLAATRIGTLVSDSDRLAGEWNRLERERAEAAEAESTLSEGAGEYGEIPDIGALERSFARLVKLGDLDERIEKRVQSAKGLSQEVARGLAQLGFGAAGRDAKPVAPKSSTLALDPETLRVPAAETLELFVEKSEAHRQRRGRLQEKQSATRAALSEVDERLASRLDAGEVPSEAALEAVRERRDAAWRELREARTEAAASAAVWRSRADAFEADLYGADALADRLRWDAERVAQQAADRARREALLEEAAVLAAESEKVDREREALVDQWRALWEPVGIDPPRSEAALRWRRDYDRVVERAGQLREAEVECERESARRSAARAELLAELAAVQVDGAAEGAPAAGSRPMDSEARLDRLLEFADEQISRLRDQAERQRRWLEGRAQAAARRKELDRERGRLEAERERWRLTWREAVAGLAPEADPPTHEITDRLATIGRLLTAVEDRRKADERVRSMRERIDAFEGDVRALLSATEGPGAEGVSADLDLSAGGAEAAVLAAHRRLQEARETETMREKIEERLEEADGEESQAQLDLERAAARLSALQVEAGAEDDGELDGALEAWKRFAEMLRKKAEAEGDLASLAGAQDLATLERESAEVDPDALSAQLEALSLACDEKIKERGRLGEKIKAEREAQDAAFGGARVAELSEQAEDRLASIRGEASRYLELRLAHKILEREMDAYRKEHQGPVLGHASAYFAALTRGAYPELRSDHGEDGGARLVAMRGEGKQQVAVPVEGLSSGTRDQLFLALRLASLEVSLGKSEPMPLIADDVLVEFDEARSEAGLECLARLGEQTQVLLFTHHAYLADQARALGSRAVVHVL